MTAVRPPLGEDLTINVCLDPVDFRMGINGLSVLIEASLKYDPFSRNLFCFTNKRRNQIKVLYWEERVLPVVEAAGGGKVQVALASAGAGREADAGAVGVAA